MSTLPSDKQLTGAVFNCLQQFKSGFNPFFVFLTLELFMKPSQISSPSTDENPNQINQKSALNGSCHNPQQQEQKCNENTFKRHIRTHYNTYFMMAVLVLAGVLMAEVIIGYGLVRERTAAFEHNIKLLEKLNSQIGEVQLKGVGVGQNKLSVQKQYTVEQIPVYNLKKVKLIATNSRDNQHKPNSIKVEVAANLQLPQQHKTTLLTDSEPKKQMLLPQLHDPAKLSINDNQIQPLISPNAQNDNTNIIKRSSNQMNLPNQFDTATMNNQQKQVFQTLAEQQKQLKFSNPQFDQQPVTFYSSLPDPVQYQLLTSTSSSSSLLQLSEQSNQIQQIETNDFTGITIAQLSQSIGWLDLNNPNYILPNIQSEKQKIYYQQKYNIGSYLELPFCIVVPSYNNVENDRHIKNMRSILMQDYGNYHIVFIDDASTDFTGFQIKQLLESQNKVGPQRYTIIRNTKQQRAMANLRLAALSYCRPEQIYLIVDGDDELIGRQVLKLYNAVFQRDKVWFMYTNFVTPRGNVGFSRPLPENVIRENTYRNYPFITSHLRAFYTQLFRNIKESDLIDQNGNYLKAANDVAICIPILQMAQDRVIYVPQLTYYYNSNTGMNNHALRLRQQKSNDAKIRYRQPYKRINTIYGNIF